MKRLYEAADGKVFNNEADCLDYEGTPPIFFRSDGSHTTYKDANFAYVSDTKSLNLFEQRAAENREDINRLSPEKGLYFAKPHYFGKKRTWEYIASEMLIKKLNSL